MTLNRLDIAGTRQELKLRQRPTGEWEVYATLHGTGVYRWWIISKEMKHWYEQHFPSIQIVKYEEPV